MTGVGVEARIRFGVAVSVPVGEPAQTEPTGRLGVQSMPAGTLLAATCMLYEEPASALVKTCDTCVGETMLYPLKPIGVQV